MVSLAEAEEITAAVAAEPPVTVSAVVVSVAPTAWAEVAPTIYRAEPICCFSCSSTRMLPHQCLVTFPDPWKVRSREREEWPSDPYPYLWHDRL